MISIEFTKANGKFISLEVSGHANSADKGEDLVCAGVSSIVFGALNGFDQLANGNFDIIVKDNLVKVKALSDACITDKLLSFTYLQLLTMEESYLSNIKIRITEV